MKTIDESLDEAYKRSGENAYFGSGFKSGVEFAQRWIPVEGNIPARIDLIFKDSNGNHIIGKVDFIEHKLCIITDLGYSLIEDSGITHYRQIELK